MNVNDMADAYEQVCRGYSVPDVMLIAYPEGTWLLSTGHEPQLLGEAKDFDRIMLEFLHGNL